jgi:Pentapeptide repeats (8 copies)
MVNQERVKILSQGAGAWRRWLAANPDARADLSDAWIDVGTDLGGIDLSGGNLCGARLIKANLRGANLSGVSVMSATLAGADPA